MATIDDVARLAGVSTSTVSYALSGKRPVAEETRNRILAVVKELDYHPHVLASNLALRHSRTVGVFFPTETYGLSEGQLELLMMITQTVTEHGYAVMLWTSPLNAEEVWRLIRQNQLAGVILAEVKRQDPRVDLLNRKGFPFVMIGRCEQTEGLNFIDLDFAECMRVCVEHLAGLGHQRVAYISVSPELIKLGYNPAICTLEAFQNYTPTYNIQGEAYTCKPTFQHAYTLTQDLLRRKPDLTGFITITDRVAVGILQAVQDMGLRIPDDVSVIGSFSQRISSMTSPPLTVVSPVEDIGKRAANILANQLEGKNTQATQVLLRPGLIVRQSSGPCRR